MKRYRHLGPGLLITAAFIGPGTIATASRAGGEFGFVLLWALVFSIIATLVLQEMAARLGLITGKGLAEAVRDQFQNPILKFLSIALITSAIGLGNAAYQTGNIAGAALGITAVVDLSQPAAVSIISLFAFLLLASGRYALIERVLILLVLTMSSLFILTLFRISPDWQAVIGGLFNPSLPDGSELLVIALIGTTVVPYNLFLHASSISQQYSGIKETERSQALRQIRWDSGLSIGLGGLVTLAIVSTAAVAYFGQDAQINPGNLAKQLEPLLGASAKYCFAIGIFAAGITSAITAPLAAAYAVSGALGWPIDLKHRKFQLIWFLIMVVGTGFALLGTKPLAAIIFAQAANGLLLPFIAVFLLLAVNSRSRGLGQFRNGHLSNLLGLFVILVVSGLGLFKLFTLL